MVDSQNSRNGDTRSLRGRNTKNRGFLWKRALEPIENDLGPSRGIPRRYLRRERGGSTEIQE